MQIPAGTLISDVCPGCYEAFVVPDEDLCQDCLAALDTCDRCGKPGLVGLAHGSNYEMVCNACYVDDEDDEEAR